MINTWFKIAWRSLWKDKFYAVINMAGLALATAAFLLIMHYVRFERSYENFYTNANDIYRITLDFYKGNQLDVTDCETHPPMAPAIKSEMPEIVDYVRVQRLEEIPELSNGTESFRVPGFYAADPSMFTVFNYDFIAGNKDALNAPLMAVITESTARRMFGTAQAMGKVMKNGSRLFTVNGVIKDLPANTHLKFDALISFSSLAVFGYNLNGWNGNNNYTYVQLRPGADLASFNAKLAAFSKRQLNDKIYTAEPIKDIHLYSHKTFEPETNGDSKTVNFLLVTAILILLIGAVNYVNLTTARLAERVKETGMRKVLGATRTSLIGQLMTENVLLNLLAMTLALVIIRCILPVYISLVGAQMTASLFNSVTFWLTCLALLGVNCLLSGIYPALALSGVKPVAVTKRTSTGTASANLFRRVLVASQFAAALIVLSASLIVYRQLNYVRHRDLGITTEQTLVLRNVAIDIADSLAGAHDQAIKNELARVPGATAVTVAGAVPGVSIHDLSTTRFRRYGDKNGNEYTFYLYGIDADFVPAMKIKLLAGRNFVAGSPNQNDVMLNRAAAKLLGFDTPESAIGQKVAFPYTTRQDYATVTGIVDDYHQQSLKESIIPMVHWYTETGNFYAVTLKTTDLPRTIAAIQQIWKEQYPGHPFEYEFLDQMFDQQYKADIQFGKVVQIFSYFTLFITCLGILGLTAYNITRRRREIGIRKVLGASVASIVGLFSQDFIRLMLLAIVVATPLAWYIMAQWLQNFAFHIDIEWWMFALAGGLMTMVALLTVGFQSVRAALADPVKSLKTE